MKAFFRFFKCCSAPVYVLIAVNIFLLLIQLFDIGLFSFSAPEGALARNTAARAYRSDGEQRVIDVYKRTNSAVVFISTITLAYDPFDFVPEFKQQEGAGSGIIVDSTQGIILTNLHVIQDAHKIEIVLSDGLSYKAKLLGHDREYDIAVLKLISPPDNLVALPPGDSSSIEVGQQVLAIGNPHGLERTLTTGIVSSLHRTVKNPNNFLMKDLIQTDAAINPGNSGGPLIDLDGRLIGINTAILSQSGDSAGIGFAVPINQIRRILPELIATGKVLRPSMDWVLVDTNQGPMVRRVLPDGAAAGAGIEPIERPVGNVFLRGYVRDFKKADVIMKVNETSVQSVEEVNQLIGDAPKDGYVSLTLRRGGRAGPERQVRVKPVLR